MIFERASYPDPARMMANLHARNLRLIISVGPGLQDWQQCGTWTGGRSALTLNLNRFIIKPGQYEVRFEPVAGKIRIAKAVLLYEGDEALPDMLVKTGEHAFNINRTAQVTEETSSVLDIRFDVAESVGTVRIRPALAE